MASDATPQLGCDDEDALATRIATCDDKDVPHRIADAIVNGPHHRAYVMFSELELWYSNSFGPRMAIGDRLAALRLDGWRTMCQDVVNGLLAKAGIGPKNMYPDRYPTVTLVPEEGSPSISAISVHITLPGMTVDALHMAQGKEAGEDD